MPDFEDRWRQRGKTADCSFKNVGPMCMICKSMYTNLIYFIWNW